MTSFDQFTVRECEDSESEIELVESLQTRKGGGQSTIDNLKDLNLETTKEPCPIYVSSLPTSKEENEYLNLLS